MELVEPDGLDPEALERGLGGLLQVVGVAVHRPGAVARAQVAALGGDQDVGGVPGVGGEGLGDQALVVPDLVRVEVVASAVSINVTPESRAAWMAAIERPRSGRPSMDMGIPPSPIAET